MLSAFINVWSKHHACGRTIANLSEWRQLPYYATQPAIPEIDVPALEYRQCSCGSHITISVIKTEET